MKYLVDDLHVSATDADVVRHVSHKFKPEIRFAREYRNERHDIYRSSIEAHHRHQDLFFRVVSGKI